MKLRFPVFYLPAVVMLSACQQENPSASPAVSTETTTPTAPLVSQANVDAAIAALKAEPKIIDLVHDPKLAVEWTIGVKDDGTSRHGYAEYVCSLLSQHEALLPGDDVRIVDYHRFMTNGGDARDASLGHVECSTNRDLGI